jgi:DNA-binding transcriptional MocR family regulator
VIYLSTFSKVLFPGMRLGYLMAPRPLVRQLALAKQAVDLHSNTLGQWLLDRFLREGRLDAHLRTLRSAYAKRRDAMRRALEQAGASGVSWTVPEGGFYFWCRLPEGVEPSALLARAAERGVVYLPGWSCFVEEPSRVFARLNFSYPTETQIAQGVARLLEAVTESSSRAVASRDEATATPPVV